MCLPLHYHNGKNGDQTKMIGNIPLLMIVPAKVTRAEKEQALKWAKSAYGARGVKKRFSSCPGSLLPRYRHCYYVPFFVLEWTRYTQILNFCIYADKSAGGSR